MFGPVLVQFAPLKQGEGVQSSMSTSQNRPIPPEPVQLQVGPMKGKREVTHGAPSEHSMMEQVAAKGERKLLFCFLKKKKKCKNARAQTPVMGPQLADAPSALREQNLEGTMST